MDPLQAFRLDGQVVIVTGATSGLGVGFARAIAAVGGQVVLAGRRADVLKDVAARLQATGATVRARPTDVAVPEDCAALVDFTMAELGKIDGLVNNAGIGAARSAIKETPEQFRQVIDVNLNGTFWMAQACAKVMAPGSSIVNVSSVLGLMASRFPQAAYIASKAGVIGLTRDLAQEWSRRRKIRVNALCPGYFRTEMTEDGLAELEDNLQRNSMLGRFGAQEELDPAVIYLLSNASSYVTGTTLVVDGGMAALLPSKGEITVDFALSPRPPSSVADSSRCWPSAAP
jgi:NAD(P)-dependent dehydrogenase (short-subunit alcohol dehydrogenase family)